MRLVDCLINRSIRRRLILGIVSIHALLMSLFVYDLVERQREFLLNQSRGQAQSLASALATSSVSWILADDVAGLQELVGSTGNYPNLRYAMVLSPQGRVLAHTRPDRVGLYAIDEVSKRLIGAPAAGMELFFNGRLIDLASPVLAGGRLIGWARVGIDQAHIGASLTAVSRDGQIYTLVAILLGMVIAAVLARGLTRGLRRLIRATSDVQIGKAGVRVDLKQDDELGQLARSFNVMLDTLDEQTQAREQAQRQLVLAAQVFENSSEGIVMTDTSNRIVAVNPAFTQITGYSREEALGQCPGMLRSGKQGEAFYEDMWHQLNTHGFWRGELWNRRKDGSLYPEWLGISVVRNEAGQIANYVGIFSDMTERKEADERVKFLAHHDGLTCLPNRLLLVERLQHALVRSRRESLGLSVLFIDYDRFKNVNDSLGHQAGDELLVQVAVRLRACVREKDTVARLGGDEFVILLEDVGDDHDAAVVAQKVLESSRQPYLAGGQEVALTASIGISVFPGDGESAENLIKNADAAMYHAKSLGRNNFQFYTAQLNAEILERLRMETKLRRAVESGELCLHYQPQVDFRSGALVGMEALVRWHHPDHGLILPARFIPVAEESGIIVELGRWVLEEACRQNKDWQDAGLPSVPVAVNISALQYQSNDFLESVLNALANSGLEPRFLELELTESLLLEEVESKLEVMRDLKQRRIKLSIDDFGTGYSNLSYLKRFPIDKLKIDRSFVRDIMEDSDDAAIVAAIVAMSRSLRLTTIAEGVETVEQYHRLKELGCNELQGYLVSPPMPPERCEAWLRSMTASDSALVVDGFVG
jgi:diguanylate cyclase (GGDEF)-like protein/PAS domain S-box-containing protein